MINTKVAKMVISWLFCRFAVFCKGSWSYVYSKWYTQFSYKTSSACYSQYISSKCTTL